MAFDLDDEESRITRELNGVVMEDIKILETFRYRQKTKNYNKITLEDIQAIENVNNFIDIVTVLLPEYSTKIPEYCIDEKSWISIKKLLNLIEKQQEQLQEKDKIIDMAIELIARKVGSRVEICPDMNCTVEKKKDCKECAIEYFTKKVREV